MVDVCGLQVIFWHGRMLHAAGLHHGDTVRFAVPADFQQAGRATVTPAEGDGHAAYPDDTPAEVVEEHGLEYHKDTSAFVDDRPPQADMWDMWAI